jgi:hypothetical protein
MMHLKTRELQNKTRPGLSTLIGALALIGTVGIGPIDAQAAPKGTPLYQEVWCMNDGQLMPAPDFIDEDTTGRWRWGFYVCCTVTLKRPSHGTLPNRIINDIKVDDCGVQELGTSPFAPPPIPLPHPPPMDVQPGQGTFDPNGIIASGPSNDDSGDKL